MARRWHGQGSSARGAPGDATVGGAQASRVRLVRREVMVRMGKWRGATAAIGRHRVGGGSWLLIGACELGLQAPTVMPRRLYRSRARGEHRAEGHGRPGHGAMGACGISPTRW